MAAGLRKGEVGGWAQRSVTWPQCPAGGSFHGPPPATCWMTIWGSFKPHNRVSIIFLVAEGTATKVKKSVSRNLESGWCISRRGGGWSHYSCRTVAVVHLPFNAM